MYGFLENVKDDVRKSLKESINADALAEKYGLSAGHLQRLFRLTYKQSLGKYIRSRKLAASIDDLVNTNLNVVDIAMNYDFDYEQSYIRSFKREFGITPGQYRKYGYSLKEGYVNEINF